MHALIIEDEPLIARLLEGELRELGFTSFDVAATEDEAVRMAEHTTPNLITADENLTRGSGFSAVQQICAKQAIPVIFITGDPTSVDLSGVVILAKPFGGQALRAAAASAAMSARSFGIEEKET
jgi:DNA-binding response OmpR family regulator